MTLFFSYFSLTQMLMCAVLLAPLWQKNQSIRLFILLMLSGCGYMLGEVFVPLEHHSIIWWFEHIGGNALPGVFWLVSLSVFSDHVVLKRWQYALASLTLLVPLSSALIQLSFSFSISEYPFAQNLLKYGSMLLELLLISHALLIAAQQWRDDLVQERRYIRGGVISVSALYIFGVIILEQMLHLQWSGFTLIKSALLSLLIMAINFFLFRLRDSSLFETVKGCQVVTAEVKPPSKELVRIINSMVQEKLYQQDGITIAGMAKHLSIHEYKLRHLINGEMNYRNFNDFLNFYRIKEITEKLQQSEFSHTPVLTLALESGFRSLSSFNKVFKATHQLTPTEYRKKVLLKS